MDFDELLSRIAEIDYYLVKRFPVSSYREKIFGRAVKLNEEVGELCGEVLTHSDGQRDHKKKSIGNLEGEFADVIITTLMLARSMNIDIKGALDKKMKKVLKKLR